MKICIEIRCRVFEFQHENNSRDKFTIKAKNS